MRTWGKVVLFHGWGGIAEKGWLRWAYTELTGTAIDVQLTEFPDPGNPNLIAWITAMNHTMQSMENHEDILVVCHSLGGITWMHHAMAVDHQIADTVLLVAPPYVNPLLLPDGAPAGVESFFQSAVDPNAVRRAARQTVVVAGENDCYSSSDQTVALANHLGVDVHPLAGGGHVSPASGYDQWPWLRAFAMGEATFPPQPREWTPG